MSTLLSLRLSSSAAAAAALVAAASAYVLYKYISFRKHVAQGMSFPSVEEPVFPLGNLLLLKDYLGTVDKMHKHKDPKTGITAFWIGDQQVLVLHKADHVQRVFQASTYRKPFPILTRHFQAILGPKNITLLMHEEWKLHRGLMSKPFQFAQLKGMASVMVESAEALVRHWAGLSPQSTDYVDIMPFMRMVTMDVIGLTAFSHDFGCVRNAHQGQPEEVRAFEFMLNEHTRRLASVSPLDRYYFFPTAANREHRRSHTILRKRVDDIIKSRRAGLEKQKHAAGAAAATAGGESKNDFLAHMLEARDETGKALSDQDLSDELITLMFGGFDTTSLALSFASHILATHPHVQAELQSEVDHVLQGRAPTFDDYSSLKYTLQVIKETLRLYPPAPLTSRHTESEVELDDGTVLPSGTHVWIPMVSVHRSPLNWEHPLEVRPERFAPANVIHPGAWIPFSGGQRNCLGMRFALLEATLVLAVLAQHFTFEAAPGEPKIKECFMSGVIQKPRGGVRVRLLPRARAAAAEAVA